MVKRPKNDKQKAAVPKKQYEPTEREVASLEALKTRKSARVPAPALAYSTDDDGNNRVRLDHPDPGVATKLLMEAVGTADQNFLALLTKQLSNAGTLGKEADGEGPNFMLSVVKSVQPKDEIEAMLASQMAAVHMATMTFARRLAHVESIPQQDSAERAFNKLARTFTTQMEALNRYRGKGQQKMTVEHVHVHEGGQAIVGNVEGGLKAK